MLKSSTSFAIVILVLPMDGTHEEIKEPGVIVMGRDP